MKWMIGLYGSRIHESTTRANTTTKKKVITLSRMKTNALITRSNINIIVLYYKEKQRTQKDTREDRHRFSFASFEFLTPCAEECGSDTNHGGSFLYRHNIIVGHPHRQLLDGGIFRRKAIAHLAHSSKKGPHFLRILRIRRNDHQTANRSPLNRPACLQTSSQLFLRKT